MSGFMEQMQKNAPVRMRSLTPQPALLEEKRSPSALLSVLNRWTAVAWRQLRKQGGLAGLQRRARRLRISETVSLGDKRFVSILEVDGQSFLLGGSGTGLTLLATLPAASDRTGFAQALHDSLQREEVR